MKVRGGSAWPVSRESLRASHGTWLGAPQAQVVVGFRLKSKLNMVVLFSPLLPQSSFEF